MNGVEFPSENQFVDVTTGINDAVKGTSAYITFKEVSYTIYRRMELSDDFICSEMAHLQVPLSIYYIGMFVKKESPLREFLNPT